MAIVWQTLARNDWMRMSRDALALGRSLPDPPPDGPGPFGLADPERTRAILESAGFQEVVHTEVDVPYRFGADVEAAVAMAREIGMLSAALDGLDADETRRAIDALRALMAEHESDDGVALGASTWVVTAVR